MKLAAFFLALLLTSEPLFAAAADIVVINADVRTMDAGKPRAEAFAITGNKFTAVGSNNEIAKLVGPSTRKIDACGRLVLPGFNDAHVHFAAIGNTFSTIDLRKAKTRTELAALISSYASVLPKGRWILGGGWDNSSKNALGLSRQLIDPLTLENPMFVFSADGKEAFANGPALKIAGIGRQTTDPAGGGIIERDAAGEATGFLSRAAVKIVREFVPTDHIRNWPEILETASNYAASLGVSSVQDMHSDELADVYRELHRQGKLKTRVYDCSPLSAWERLAAARVNAASGNVMVRTGCVKAHAPFADDERARLENDIIAADKAGLQVMIHAVGPAANRKALTVLEKMMRRNGRRDRRARIEHAAGVSDEDVPRFARSGIIASMQPWLFFSGVSVPAAYAEHYKLGTRMAFGSDASMSDFDPIAGILAAATGAGAISIEKSIRAYTIGSAYGEFRERVKGTVTTGKLADIVILSDRVTRQNVALGPGAGVDMTFVNGKIVYSRSQSI